MVHRGKRGGTAHKAKKTGETKNTQKGKGIEKGESTVEAKSTQNTQEAQGTQNAGGVQEVQNTQAAHIKQNVVFAIEMAVVFPRLRDPREAAGLVWTEKAMPVLTALRSRLELPGLDIRIKEAHDFTGWSMTRNQFNGIEPRWAMADHTATLADHKAVARSIIDYGRGFDAFIRNLYANIPPHDSFFLDYVPSGPELVDKLMRCQASDEIAGLMNMKWVEKSKWLQHCRRVWNFWPLTHSVPIVGGYTGHVRTKMLEFNLTLGWNRRENLRLQINFACLFVEAAIFGTKSRISSSLDVRKTEVGRLVKFMYDQRESRLDPDEREALRKLLIVDD
ncbi:hypothetical protein F5X98DRAFT_390997 [Xylaria grammica]|nr:hypothetical protein F5X98DRAFT_390997 [Xylaria grammica]